MARTSITTADNGHVTISYDDEFSGERVTRTFFCNPDGGYVKEADSAGRYPQVCERLSVAGSTLMASSREKLPEIIRREYRKMRAAEARREI